MTKENEAKLKAIFIRAIDDAIESGEVSDLLDGIYWGENTVAYAVDSLVNVLLAVQESCTEFDAEVS